jgi:hypothetical protein
MIMLLKNFSLTSISIVYKRDDSMPVRHKFILEEKGAEDIIV